MRIPLCDLKAQYQSIAADIDRAIASVIDQTAFIGGPFVKKFEEEFAAFLGCKSCHGVGNGTDALIVAMAGLGIKPGDEVIVPAMTFIATSEAVTRAGGKVVFSDVDPITRCLDPEKTEAAVTDRTAGIIAVHLYGRPAPMKALGEICKKHGLWLLEDAAQAQGATEDGQRIGSLGDAACFSFYPGKNLGAYGDAGAIVCNDEARAKQMRMLANHGRADKHGHLFEGINSRLDGLQAAILSVKLPHLDAWNQQRRQAAEGYRQRLAGLPLTLPQDHPGHIYHQFAIELDRRDDLLALLKSQEIGASIHYPHALPLLPAYEHLGHRPGDFPVAEKLAQTFLSLPIFPEITAEQQDFVCDQIRTFLEGA